MNSVELSLPQNFLSAFVMIVRRIAEQSVVASQLSRTLFQTNYSKTNMRLDAENNHVMKGIESVDKSTTT